MAGDDASRGIDPADQVGDGWRALTGLADRHAGYFTTGQMRRAGCADRVRAGLADGSVTRVGIGMWRMAGWPVGPLDEYALWAAWFDGAAAVSHHSAAELHGLGRLRPRYLHLTVARGLAPGIPRLAVLRRTLAGSEVESAGAFLVTTPLRTVLDLAESEIGQPALDEVVADAVAIHRCAEGDIGAATAGTSPRAHHRLNRALTRA